MSCAMPVWDEVRELDSSTVIALHLRGHNLTDDEAVAFAWGVVIREEIGYDYDTGGCAVAFDPPRRVWVRKIPSPDEYGSMTWLRYEYQNFAARGASPIILIEFSSGWRFRCDLPGCENHYVKGGASTGFPVEGIIDPPVGRQDDRWVYLCRRHARSYQQRHDAAVKARVAEWRAERAAAGAA